MPTFVSKGEPVYPDIARRARIEGTVIFLIRIRKDGTVGSTHGLKVLISPRPM